MKTNKLGFSLIELLVALSILAVVAAIIVPRFLNVRQSAADTMATAQVKVLNNIFSQWVSLGGNPNTATVGQVVDFLSRPGSTTSSSRVSGNPCTDTTGNFGSGTISFSGVTISTTAAAITATSSDGFLITNGTPATLGATGGLVFKTGNRAYAISYSAPSSTPFSITPQTGGALGVDI